MSRVFKALMTADWHIDKKYPHSVIDNETGIDVRLDDLITKINCLPEMCRSLGAEAIFIAGDIFDRPNPDPYSMGVFIDFLLSCLKEKIHVFAIPGQHDIEGGVVSYQHLRKLSWLWDEYIHLYVEKTKANLGGCDILFLPYGEYDCSENYDIVVTHGIPYKSRVNKAVLKGDKRINKAIKKAKVSIVGDLHNSNVGISDRAYIIPGSIMRFSFSDEGNDKGLVLLTMEDGNPSSAEFIDLEDRDYITLIITRKAQIESVCSGVKEGDVVRVFINRDIDAVMVKNLIREKGALSVDILYSQELLNEEIDTSTLLSRTLTSKAGMNKSMELFIKSKGFGNRVLQLCKKEAKL